MRVGALRGGGVAAIAPQTILLDRAADIHARAAERRARPTFPVNRVRPMARKDPR